MTGSQAYLEEGGTFFAEKKKLTESQVKRGVGNRERLGQAEETERVVETLKKVQKGKAFPERGGGKKQEEKGLSTGVLFKKANCGTKKSQSREKVLALRKGGGKMGRKRVKWVLRTKTEGLASYCSVRKEPTGN